MKIFIKNMVCPRCILVVKQILITSGLKATNVVLGEVDLDEKPADKQWLVFKEELGKVGFELLADQKLQKVEKVKTTLIQKVQQGKIEEHFSVSAFLKGRVFKNYSYISKLFSEVSGTTIENYFILQKIEKAKEWLVYNEMTVSEIALQLGYTNSQNFSSQFKRIAGVTPTGFKKDGILKRKHLDEVSHGVNPI